MLIDASRPWIIILPILARNHAGVQVRVPTRRLGSAYERSLMALTEGAVLAGHDGPALVREDDGLDAVAQVELRQDARDVCLDGRTGYHELVGDFGIGKTTGNQTKHLELALGELSERFGGHWSARALLEKRLDQAAGNGWG